MPRLREVKEFVPVRAPGWVLKEEGQYQLDQCEDIEEVSRFHREKVKRSGCIRGKF